jgi:anti-sigma-K factor RskA
VNVQDYISSGIVESYVLGLASPEEQLDFERICKQYPEVLQARTDFELAMEQQAVQNAIAPPPALKQQVMNAVLPSEAKIVPLNNDAPSIVKANWFKYAAAACAVLLAGSLYWNISQFSRNSKLQASYDEVAKDYDSTALRLSEVEDEIAMMTLNPNVKMAAMKGKEISPASYATVYWDSTSKDVYLLVNNLPKPPSEKQYQLWALLDGQPIDVGMIDNDFFVGQKKLLLRMKNVSGAQAFAITLEEKGGSPTPKGPMYTLGNL